MTHPNNPRTFATPDSQIVQRVSQELRNDYRKNFARGGTVHFEHFPAFTVRYPNVDPSLYPTRFPEFMAGNLTDKYAKDTLEKDFRCLNWLRECTLLVPLYTTGDGNCLLHAASLAMWGFEDRQYILRSALHESLTTADDRNTNTLQDRCRMSIYSMLRDVQVNMSDNDWYLEWQQIVNQAKPSMGGHHQSLEESHIFVLANILRRPIIVYGVPKARSFSTGGTMQNINFHGVYLPLLWGSQLCHKPPLCLGYGMGHFTALVPSGNRQQQLVVPLTDNYGHVLPIRFLLQAEEQNTFYLLEQYLDVIQQYSSSLGKQIPVAVIALREATHMQHLVQAYIDMSLTMFREQNQPYYTQSQPPAPSQGERKPCVGCETGAFGTVETNFLCSVCYKNQTTAAAAAGYSGSQGLKCRSLGCQQQGLSSKEGYCIGCYAKASNPGGGNQWNNLGTGQGSPQGVAKVQNPPAPRPTGEPGQREKCRECKDFFANEEYGGLCSACFKKLTIAESQQKPAQPQQQYVQPTAVQVNNNVEAAADKCSVCKDFHGFAEFGGLCSVCFKNKSKEESTAKPPQQPLNDFRQNPTTPYQAQQRPPVQQQQPVYNQGQTNPPPVASSQPQPNPFGFNQCMSHGCARAADEQSHGYCTQCFANNVARYQKSQQDQQRVMGQQGQQQWQQDEQMRREQELRRQQAEKEQTEQRRREQEFRQQQEHNEQARREQEFRAQQAEKKRIEEENLRREQENKRLEQERINQQATIKQPPMINETPGSGFVPQAKQRQVKEHAVTYSAGTLCKNDQCGDFAVENCDGYCTKCFSEYGQPADATASSHTNSPQIGSTQKRPPIKPRKSIQSQTELLAKRPANEAVETLSVGGRSNSAAAPTTSEIKCFMCAKVKPNTGDLSYSLCPAHAQEVAMKMFFDAPPPASQQPEALYTTQQSSYQVHETIGDQQRRGSAEHIQVTGPGRYSAEQKVIHHSREHQRHMNNYLGEQHQTGSHNSGEQLSRVPQPSPPNQPLQPHQMNISTHHHSGEQTSRLQHNWSHESQPHTTELPFGGPQSGYPPNSKHYGRSPTSGQASYQQGSLPMGSQTGSQGDYDQRTNNMQDDYNRRFNQSGIQDDVNQRTVNLPYDRPTEQQSFPPPGHKPNYGDHQNQIGVTSSMREIKYPPDLIDQRHNNPPRDHMQHANNQFYRQPDQFGGPGGTGYPSGRNDQYPQSYQQQPSQNFPQQPNFNQPPQNYNHQQQNYDQQHPGGAGNYVGANQQQYQHQQQNNGQQQQQSGGGNQGYGAASNYGTPGSATNYPPQAGNYREGAGGPLQKPPINSHADPNATHPHNDDMPHAKVLCKYPGCSFYADPKFDYYCQDCFDSNKSGLQNYKRCQIPTCGNHVPTTNASKFCDSCLMSTANKH